MTREQLLEIFNFITAVECSDEQRKALLEMAANTITVEKLSELVDSNDGEDDKNTDKRKSHPLKFTKKELSKMPIQFRKQFILNDRLVRCRRRKSGKKTVNYEIRYRRDGYNISVSSNDLEKAKEKFIEALKNADRQDEQQKAPTTFNGFAMYYFENFKKKKVSPETYKGDLYRYNKHIAPHFKDVPIRSITTGQCQKLLDKYTEQGMGKTADEVHSLLNQIFKMAIAHNIIERNPIATVVHTQHEREHGKALTKDEERALLEGLKGTNYLIPFAVALYTGMRPNEYKTARIDGDFIIAVNSKRKTKKVEYKRIAISPMLKPYLEGVSELNFPYVESMRTHMNKHVKGHKLYDLRTTFYTRCRECGVADAARDEFMGHSAGALAKAYTDLSDEYLYAEAQKLNY